jgi:hypothetical protein
MGLTTYASDAVAITTVAASALELAENDVVDAGALEPEQYVQAKSNIGGNAKAYVTYVKWFVTGNYTNGVNVFADQYAVSIVCRKPADFADAKAKGVTLRGALNGLAYKVDGKIRKAHVTDGFPRFNDDLSVHSLQFFVDVI